MKTLTQKWMLLGVLCALVGAVACGDDDGPEPMEDGGTPGMDSSTPDEDSGTPGEDAGEPTTMVTVDADITSDTMWTADNTYLLAAPIYVSDATLTIEAGTTIMGTSGANALIVTTTGRVDAEGTADAPIVFTSANDPGARGPGDWGGVVLLGEAPINVPGGTNNIEGLDPGEARGQYGGDDATHDCGTLRYVRIEWAGFVFGDDNELNGLTLGGCGSDTVLEHIQVHGGLDDGIEFFGGTANLKWAVVTQVGDDSLDWDQGYQGKIQFFVAQQSVGNRGIEADNLGDNNDVTPRSNPTVYNMTLVGGGAAEQQGMRLRRGTAGIIANAIVTGFSMEECVRVDGTSTITQANDGDLVIQNSLLEGCVEDGGMVGYFDFTPDEGDMVMITADWTTDNKLGEDPMLGDATNLDAPNFIPAAASPAASDAATPPDDGFFDATATYMGAFEPDGDDWMAGWTAFPILPE